MCIRDSFVDRNDLLHSLLSRSADGGSLFYAGLHADGLVHILLKYRADGLKLIQSHVIQRDALVDAEQHQLAYNAVGITERYAVIYQIVSRVGRVGEAILCACFHYFLIKGHGRDHAGKMCIRDSSYSLP